ncbi:MAG: beta-galactosidase [Opitutaceae bacterium]|nr:beta-galactosidase [Opitutaceae bacterium]
MTAEIRDKSQPDPPAVRITVSVNDEWQDFSEEFVPAVDIAGIHSSLQFILAASGTLLLDQVRLIGGGSRPERNMPKPQPRLPPATVRNLIPNGSFECGADGWLSLGKALSFGGNIAGLYGEVVTGGASEGARSFRLKLGPGLTPESYFDCWPPQHAVHHRLLTVNRGWIDVQRDRSYTLSAYMRSDRPGTKGVLQFNFSGDARNGVQTLSKEVQLTTAWARYSYTVVAPEDSVFVGVGPDVSESPETNVTFWTDALQLEVGTTATPYVGEPVEVGFSTGRYGNVFTANEPFAIDVSARNSTAAALALEIRAALTDYWDRPMPEKSVILEISAGTDAATTIPLDLPPGFYRARFSWAESGQEGSRQMRLAVIEPYRHQNSPFGLNHGPTTQKACRMFTRAGVTWIRDWSVNWEWAEPRPGERSFAAIDGHIGRLRDAGMNILSLLPSNPSTDWASEAPDTVPSTLWYRLAYAPKVPARLFDFVSAAAAHYRQVGYWEFLNEPLWVPDFCLPKKGGYTVADYITLLKGASAAIRHANPQAKVIGGLGIQAEMPLGDEFIKEGGLDHVDILNLHPYAGTRRPESFIPDLLRIRGVMDKYATRKTIWATETAYYGVDEFPFLPWQPPTNHFAANRLLVNERQSADFLVRFATILLAHGVEKIFWHEPVTGNANEGLRDIENLFIAPGGLPRKSYAAIAGLANALGPAPTFSGHWLVAAKVANKSTQNVHGYAFSSGDASVLVAWDEMEVGQAANWTLVVPEGCSARNIAGAPLAGSRIALSGSPVYVVSATLTPGELARLCLLQQTP